MRLFVLCAVLFFASALSAAAQTAAPKDQAAIGNRAPEFAATALNGKVYKLEDFKDKVVVMNFWSTKCIVCVEEMAELNKIVETFKDKNVVFLGFANESQPNVEKFLKKHRFKYQIFPASMQAMITTYGKPQANGFYDMPFPLHVVVNQQGVVEVNAVGFEGAAAVRQKLTDIFAIKVLPKAESERNK